jgi:hypothetical protein
MSDTTAAMAFGAIFEALADTFPSDPVDNGCSEHPAVKVAKVVWSEARQFDFSWMDMECDEALVKLGLAVWQNLPEDEGERTAVYQDEPAFRHLKERKA